ncbi:hypothetical protein B0J17DRAFT_459045 [Rhizoctonia solani]|nr:hypothetical protein B0J17DRAFT_459045 [Rhizoctonia solani]
MPFNALPRYGPNLDEYLRSKLFETNHHELPSRQDVRQAIQSLYDPQKVSCTTLETILALEYVPVSNLELLRLKPMAACERMGVHRSVIRACIDLMLAYCKDEKGALLDHVLGFLCLRVIALFVHYGILGQTSQLDPILDLVSSLTPSQSSIFPALSKYTWCSIGETITSKDEITHDEIWVIKWYQDQTTGKTRGLSWVGGCTPGDAISLLGLL